MPTDIGIYALRDPQTNKIRYIGRSFDIQDRYRQHLSPSNFNNKTSWIFELRKMGLFPILEIIEQIPRTLALSSITEREKFWIKHYRALGEADLNVASLTRLESVKPQTVERFLMQCDLLLELLDDLIGTTSWFGKAKDIDPLYRLLEKLKHRITHLKERLG